MSTVTDQPKPLTLRQYAHLLGITKRTALEWIHAGRVPTATKVGPKGHWRIPVDEVPTNLRPYTRVEESAEQRKKRAAAAKKKLASIK